MHVLELKVPPVALVFLVAALMWLVSWAMPAFEFEFPSGDVLAVSAAITGTIISGLGIVSFRQARTTVNPMKPDSTSSIGSVRHLSADTQSDVSRLSVGLIRVGHLLVERIGLRLSSGVRPLHEPLSNQTGGKGASRSVRATVRHVYRAGA
jgi:hypothetical protein